MRTSFGLFLVLLLSGCGPQPADPDTGAIDAPGLDPATVAMNDTVTLAVGQLAKVDGESMTVRLVGVSDDSRCPVDVTCVWAGDAIVALEVMHGGTEHTIGLHANPAEDARPGHAIVGGFRIELLVLGPEPRSGATITQDGYRATLRIDRTS